MQSERNVQEAQVAYYREKLYSMLYNRLPVALNGYTQMKHGDPKSSLPWAVIRKIKASDAEGYFNVVNESDTAGWLGCSKIKSVNQAAMIVGSTIAGYARGYGSRFAIAGHVHGGKNTELHGEMIGIISAGISPILGGRGQNQMLELAGAEVKLGYCLMARYRGQGIMESAINTLLGVLDEIGKLTNMRIRVVANVTGNNVASRTVLESCGFVAESSGYLGVGSTVDTELIKYKSDLV